MTPSPAIPAADATTAPPHAAAPPPPVATLALPPAAALLSSRQRQALAWLGVAAVAWFALGKLAPVLTPFIVGWALAYVLSPAVAWLRRHRWPKAIAALVVEVLALTAITLALLLLVPVLMKEIPALRDHIPPLLDLLDRRLAPWLRQFGVDVSFDVASLKAWLTDMLGTQASTWAKAAFDSAMLGGSTLMAVVGNAVLIPVVTFYLLLDGGGLWARVRELIPPSRRDTVLSFFAECDDMLGQYLRGQLAVMLLLALYYAGALWLAGFDLAVPVGVFTGLAVFVPYVGFGLGLVLAIVAALLQFGSATGLAWVAAIYGFGQLLESFVLTPRLVGERIGMSPLAVIFALMAFGQLFGFVGVLVALPMSALAVVAARRLKRAYLKSAMYRG